MREMFEFLDSIPPVSYTAYKNKCFEIAFDQEVSGDWFADREYWDEWFFVSYLSQRASLEEIDPEFLLALGDIIFASSHILHTPVREFPKKHYYLYKENLVTLLKNAAMKDTPNLGAIYALINLYINNDAAFREDELSIYMDKINFALEMGEFKHEDSANAKFILALILPLLSTKVPSLERPTMTPLSLIEEAANQGLARAQMKLGCFYFKGRFVTKDLVKALDWFQKAADQDHPHAQICLINGLKLAKENRDVEKIAQLALQSAQRWGYATAQMELGFIYLKGYGFDIDVNKAFSWFKKAAQQGYTIAMYNLGIAYLNGRGTQKDVSASSKWFLKAAERNHKEAQYIIASHYLCREDNPNFNIAEATKWFLKAGSTCCTDGGARYTQLAIFYFMGTGVSKNTGQALTWFNEAAKLGNANAQYCLGLLYMKGEPGIPINYKEAEKWFEKVVAQTGQDQKTQRFVALSKARLSDLRESQQSDPPYVPIATPDFQQLVSAPNPKPPATRKESATARSVMTSQHSNPPLQIELASTRPQGQPALISLSPLGVTAQEAANQIPGATFSMPILPDLESLDPVPTSAQNNKRMLDATRSSEPKRARSMDDPLTSAVTNATVSSEGLFKVPFSPIPHSSYSSFLSQEQKGDDLFLNDMDFDAPSLD